MGHIGHLKQALKKVSALRRTSDFCNYNAKNVQILAKFLPEIVISSLNSSGVVQFSDNGFTFGLSIWFSRPSLFLVAISYTVSNLAIPSKWQ